MAVIVGHSCSVDIRKVLFIGTILLLTCAMAALVLAIQEYLSAGEFFGLKDIMHHEAVELALLTFGLGIFFAGVGFSVYHRNQTTDLIQYPMLMPVAQPYPIPTRAWPPHPNSQRRR